jgi:hypothetical protein
MSGKGGKPFYPRETIVKALIVGGDSVEPVRRQLQAQGFVQVSHWQGRKTGDCRRAFPQNLDLIVIMLSYVNHNLCKRARQEADRHDCRVVFLGKKTTVPLDLSKPEQAVHGQWHC